jgi:hypothetical protein
VCLFSFCPGEVALLVGLLDGRIMVRSSVTLATFFVIDANICNTRTVWGIVSCGDGTHFVSSGDDANVILWSIPVPLITPA